MTQEAGEARNTPLLRKIFDDKDASTHIEVNAALVTFPEVVALGFSGKPAPEIISDIAKFANEISESIKESNSPEKRLRRINHIVEKSVSTFAKIGYQRRFLAFLSSVFMLVSLGAQSFEPLIQAAIVSNVFQVLSGFFIIAIANPCVAHIPILFKNVTIVQTETGNIMANIQYTNLDFGIKTELAFSFFVTLLGVSISFTGLSAFLQSVESIQEVGIRFLTALVGIGIMGAGAVFAMHDREYTTFLGGPFSELFSK